MGGGSSSEPSCTKAGDVCTVDSECCGGGSWSGGKYTGTYYCMGADTYNLNGIYTGTSDIETCIPFPSAENTSGQFNIIDNDYEWTEVLTYLLALIGLLWIVYMLFRFVRKQFSKPEYAEVGPEVKEPVKTFQSNVV